MQIVTSSRRWTWQKRHQLFLYIHTIITTFSLEFLLIKNGNLYHNYNFFCCKLWGIQSFRGQSGDLFDKSAVHPKWTEISDKPCLPVALNGCLERRWSVGPNTQEKLHHCKFQGIVWVSILCTYYLSIVSMISDASCSLETSSKGMTKQKSLHLFLSKHSLLACSSPPPLSAPLSCTYYFTLSLHLLTGLPLLFAGHWSCLMHMTYTWTPRICWRMHHPQEWTSIVSMEKVSILWKSKYTDSFISFGILWHTFHYDLNPLSWLFGYFRNPLPTMTTFA